MRAAQRSSPAVVPPPAGAVLPPAPARVRTHSRILPGRGGGALARAKQHRFRRRQALQAEGSAPLAGLPGSKKKATQAFSRPAGCSRAPLNETCLRVSSCTSPPRPRYPRHLRPFAGMKAVEAWRRREEGRGRCRYVRSSPRGATAGATGYRRWFWFLMKTRALPQGGANRCRRSCGAGCGESGCVHN